MTKKQPRSSSERPHNLSEWARLGQVSEDQAQLNLAAARPALDVLKNKLARMQTGMGKADYDSPSWAYKQAHHNGFNEALRLIENFLP